MGQGLNYYFINYKLFLNYAFNIRLNIEAQSSKYWPIWTAGQGSKYWTGLVLAVITLAVITLAVVTLAVITLAVVILAVVTLALICSCL
jgi:hypothetical protein